MNWNCALTEERLSDYLEGALAPAEREACAVHAAECAGCAEILSRVGELVGQMHALEPLLEPAFLSRRITRGTLGARAERHELAGIGGWLNLIWQPRFAMGIAMVAATFVILAHTAGLRLSSLKPSGLNPFNVAREANRQAHLTYARGEKFVNDLRVVYEIRAVLAAPPPAPSGQQNQAAPAPSGAPPSAPDTQERSSRELQRDAITRKATNNLHWAMLDPAFDKFALLPANRRPL